MFFGNRETKNRRRKRTAWLSSGWDLVHVEGSDFVQVLTCGSETHTPVSSQSLISVAPEVAVEGHTCFVALSEMPKWQGTNRAERFAGAVALAELPVAELAARIPGANQGNEPLDAHILAGSGKAPS